MHFHSNIFGNSIIVVFIVFLFTLIENVTTFILTVYQNLIFVLLRSIRSLYQNTIYCQFILCPKTIKHGFLIDAKYNGVKNKWENEQ